jgi:hypothetical protein
MSSAIHAHFVAAGLIWDRYFAGEISAARRDALLAPLREALARL